MAHHKLQDIPVPIKRQAKPYHVIPTSPQKSAARQGTILAPLIPNLTLPWSHSVSNASLTQAFAEAHHLGQTVYGYSPPHQFQSPLFNINSMMLQPNVFGHRSLSAPQVLTPTQPSIVVHLNKDEDDEELPHPLDILDY
ncbi:uncharacterized protein MELLADRAFT_67193 [Melampsora larici-populina 98AG31]|uniref:Uncharacterized protein n=1 Tax=Melampsora larici-populina (strain 98AG31 / pathotype 3-4-7) TaxID=747676 RepID=F4S251_MELLP|nr:uncharacterized protein MELLADRAFT_67193 [Melampsora larici-populina 98AG31]EGG01320.1 hypothetical protein MELLADRAFT_67193 [Melampsora larici-populina 98AG31]